MNCRDNGDTLGTSICLTGCPISGAQFCASSAQFCAAKTFRTVPSLHPTAPAIALPLNPCCFSFGIILLRASDDDFFIDQRVRVIFHRAQKSAKGLQKVPEPGRQLSGTSRALADANASENDANASRQIPAETGEPGSIAPRST